MSVDELLVRARGQVGQQTIYGLGRGSTLGVSPKDEKGMCDCSAFVCWCLDIRKRQTQFAWLTKLNGGWFNTDGMWWDAKKEATGLFEQIAAPRPGGIVVYPAKSISQTPGPAIGHVAIIASVDSAGGYRVVHCSSGNFTKTGDAIHETAPTMFKPSATIFAWPAGVSS